MRDINTAKTIFDRYGGIMKTSELSKEKIYYADIANLIRAGVVEKIRHSYYQWVDSDNLSEAVTISKLFPDGILCMDTALRHYGYSDRTPAEWHIAVNKFSNRTRFKIDYRDPNGYEHVCIVAFAESVIGHVADDCGALARFRIVT